jgi:hypothetical protein
VRRWVGGSVGGWGWWQSFALKAWDRDPLALKTELLGQWNFEELPQLLRRARSQLHAYREYAARLRLLSKDELVEKLLQLDPSLDEAQLRGVGKEYPGLEASQLRKMVERLDPAADIDSTGVAYPPYPTTAPPRPLGCLGSCTARMRQCCGRRGGTQCARPRPRVP